MTSKAQVDEKKDWLIKSSTKILGPFTAKNIVDLLKSQAVAPTDEARRCDQRWTSMREVKEFIPVIQSLKFEVDAGEHTLTSATISGNTTKTERVTEVTEDLTPTPVGVLQPSDQSLRPSLKNVAPLRESTVSARPAHLTGKAFGLQDDLRLQREIEVKTNHWRWVIIGLIFLVVGSYAGFQFFQSQKKLQEYSRRLQAAQRFRSLQLYDQALNEYKKLLFIKEPDLSVQAQMAPLMIAIDSETLKGRRILEKVVTQSERSRSQKADDYTGIGLSYLIEGNLKEASDAFNKALSFDQKHFAANLNSAWIMFEKRNFQEAAKIMANIRPSGHPMLAVAQGMASLESVLNFHFNGLIQTTVTDLQKSLRDSQNLKVEQLLLIVLLLQSQAGTSIQYGQDLMLFMKRVLEEPQRSQRYFVQDPLIFRKWVDGPQWDRYCNGIKAIRQNIGLSSMTRAACFLNIGNTVEAKKLVDEKIRQTPRDPLALLMQMSVDARSNRVASAVTIAKSSELREFRLPQWVMGKICLEAKDLICAQTAFRNVLEKNPVDVYARGGLAAVYHQLGQKSEALKTINIGLTDEPLFLPLLELRDILESQ